MISKSGSIWMIALSLAVVRLQAAEISYDQNRTLILDCRILSVDWSGKYLNLVVHSNDGYQGNDWTVVGPEVKTLLKMGWKEEYLSVGEHLDTVIHPDKSGKMTGQLIRFYLTDGRTLEISPYGTTRPIPREALNARFQNPADDPMFGFYGNTQVFWASDPKGPPEANYNGHSWYNSDHTLLMFSNDMRPDGTWSQHQVSGVWWLQKEKDKWTRCMQFSFSLYPYCHSPISFEKLGDNWQLLFHGQKANWYEHRSIEAGQH